LGTQLVNQHQLPKADWRVSFSQLLGMSDHISFNLSNSGYKVSKYVPYGPVLTVIPYLTRRAQENSGMAGQMGRELALIEEEIKRRKA
jgi:proline dehydrogenase